MLLAGELTRSGWDINLAFMRYGPRWRTHRRMFHQEFRAEAASNYHPILQTNVKTFTRSLRSSPEEFALHLRDYTSAIVLYTTYGYKDGRLTELAQDTADMIIRAFLPNASSVHNFPFLSAKLGPRR